MELCDLQAAMVGLDNSFDAVAFWLEIVTIHSKLVIGHREALNASAKAICRNKLIRVVVLKNSADRFQGLKILVLVNVFVMQRIRIICLPVGSSEVNSDDQVQLAAAEDVLEEVDDRLELKTLHNNGLVADFEFGAVFEFIDREQL